MYVNVSSFKEKCISILDNFLGKAVRIETRATLASRHSKVYNEKESKPRYPRRKTKALLDPIARSAGRRNRLPRFLPPPLELRELR
jgi:hypothetical protein